MPDTVASVHSGSAAGELLRDWRQRRRLSQLDLAHRADVSPRHLSFLETGRARPSREMVLRLVDELDVPLLARNSVLAAAGYSPVFRETPMDAPEMEGVRAAIDAVVGGHEPFPAYVTDRLWNLVTFNDAALMLASGVAPHLLEAPINAMRLGLHPEGMAARVINFDEYSGHHLARLRRQVELTGDPDLTTLYDEVRRYPGVATRPPSRTVGSAANDIVVSLRYRTDDGELRFFNTVASFGTAVDITLEDLVIEFLFPADDRTRQSLLTNARP